MLIATFFLLFDPKVPVCVVLLTGELECLSVHYRSNKDDRKLSKLTPFGDGLNRGDIGWSEPHVKDSGIDTGLSSSSQTLNEDHLKVNFSRRSRFSAIMAFVTYCKSLCTKWLVLL